MTTAILILLAVLPWVLLGALTWLFYEGTRQNGRILLGQEQLAGRLASLETAVIGSQPGERAGLGAGSLSIGEPAPRFTLRDLSGRDRNLEEFLGEPLLIIFFSTTCGYCVQMSPRLGELPDGSPRILLVSRGDPSEHRHMAELHGWACDVLLEEEWEVATAYRASGTPTGYLIGAGGNIVSELAVGADSVLSLAELANAEELQANGRDGALTRESLREKEQAAMQRAQAAGLAVRDVSESRLKRDGLGAGTRAPDFDLPDIDGGRHKLTDFRGQNVLLVFSDTGCGPCETLAPRLMRVAQGRQYGGPQVVMISRGTLEDNAAKARQQGLTFPVLLQRSWEVSRDYAMFATPVAYLIDEQGVIAKDVAVGLDEILDLVAEATPV